LEKHGYDYAKANEIFYSLTELQIIFLNEMSGRLLREADKYSRLRDTTSRVFRRY